jgi:hypothetical protein
MDKPVVLGILVVGSTICALGAALVRRLKCLHPQAWEAVGRPSPLWAAFGHNVSRLHRFLRSKSFRELGDRVLLRMRAAILGLSIVLFAIVLWGLSRR